MQNVTDSEFSLFRSLSNPEKTKVPSKLAQPQNPHPKQTSSTSVFNERPVGNESNIFDDGDPSGFSQSNSHHAPFPPNPPMFTPPKMSAEEEEWEKQGLLLELSQFQQQGIALSRPFSMQDSLMQIKFEYDTIRSNQEQLTKVKFAREALFFCFRGIEMANKKVGPILRLEGWADYVSHDKSQYDNALNRIYKQYWRHGRQMSPITELTLGILMSMFMFHFQQVAGMGAPTPSASPASGNSAGSAMGMMSSMMGSMFSGKTAQPTTKPPPPPPPSAQEKGPSTNPSRRQMRKPVVLGATEPATTTSRENASANSPASAMPQVQYRPGQVNNNQSFSRINNLESELEAKNKQINQMQKQQETQHRQFMERLQKSQHQPEQQRSTNIDASVNLPHRLNTAPSSQSSKRATSFKLPVIKEQEELASSFLASSSCSNSSDDSDNDTNNSTFDINDKDNIRIVS